MGGATSDLETGHGDSAPAAGRRRATPVLLMCSHRTRLRRPPGWLATLQSSDPQAQAWRCTSRPGRRSGRRRRCGTASRPTRRRWRPWRGQAVAPRAPSWSAHPAMPATPGLGVAAVLAGPTGTRRPVSATAGPPRRIKPRETNQACRTTVVPTAEKFRLRSGRPQVRILSGAPTSQVLFSREKGLFSAVSVHAGRRWPLTRSGRRRSETRPKGPFRHQKVGRKVSRPRPPRRHGADTFSRELRGDARCIREARRRPHAAPCLGCRIRRSLLVAAT